MCDKQECDKQETLDELKLSLVQQIIGEHDRTLLEEVKCTLNRQAPEVTWREQVMGAVRANSVGRFTCAFSNWIYHESKEADESEILFQDAFDEAAICKNFNILEHITSFWGFRPNWEGLQKRKRKAEKGEAGGGGSQMGDVAQ